MSLSKFKAKPPFSGSLRAFKKILKHSDQNLPPDRSLVHDDSSDASTSSTPRSPPQALPELPLKKSKRPLLSELLFSTDTRPSEGVEQQPCPSLPPLFFDASSSNTSFVASSTACSHPIDEPSPSRSQTPRRNHNHKCSDLTSVSSPTTPRPHTHPRPPSPSTPWSPNSTLVAFDGPYRSSPRETKPLQSAQASNRRSSGNPRVSDLIANYEALAIAVQAAQALAGPSSSSSPTRSPLRRHCRQGPDIDCGHLEQIRSLEKRIEELEKEHEEQAELIAEMQEENESFYMRLCETNRQNKKLKKRLRTIAQSALDIHSEDESDYGLESPSGLLQTHDAFGPTSASAHPHTQTQTPTDSQSEFYPSSPSQPTFNRRSLSHYSRRTSRRYSRYSRYSAGNDNLLDTDSRSHINIETLRSDMLSKPHGFYVDSDYDEYDWCSEENGSLNDVYPSTSSPTPAR
ncbi:hypothetical protein D9758_005781 [Tetrapyrgos nigripes]|uniref:Uncharacterized protein n=1 Tax=Tetrapyrgos nigripes TaxID=182062 RepID=A0A8H5LQF7_9AGAR|nr:hypothetical protein D9758_005781 [Tetrapyrgos nigripes]